MSIARVVAEPLERRRLFAAAANSAFIFGSGTGYDDAQKAVTDASGNVYVTGLFSGTVDFDRKPVIPGGGTKLTARGDTDIYVAKYLANGDLAWVIQMGGDYTNKRMERIRDRDIAISPRRLQNFVGKVGSEPRLAGEYVNDLALDSAGNAFIVGSFRSDITVGNKTLSADNEFSSSFYDALVVKISSGGKVSWSKQISGPFDDDALTVAVDNTGAPVVGGYYQRQANFNVGGKQSLLTVFGRDAGYVARYTADGALSWTYQFTSKDLSINERNSVNDLAIAPNGSIYAVGTFAYKANFDPGRSNYTIKSERLTDAFVLNLTRKGQFGWVESTGGDGYDGNSTVAVGADGSVYTGGYFANDVDVNPLPNVTTIFTANQGNGTNNSAFTDLLISKFTAKGMPVWQDQISGKYFETISDMTVGPNGGIYTSGSFFNTVNFAPGRGKAVLTSTLTNDGSIKDNNTSFGRNESYDAFVQVLSPRGKFVSVKQFGGADDDFGQGISVTNTGGILLAGRYTRAVGDRNDRLENAIVYLLNPALDIVPLLPGIE